MADHDMTDESDPALIQAPGWLDMDGHDLQISSEKPAIDDELRVVLDAAPLGPDHALVRERIGQYDTHTPIYPGDTSYGTTRSYYGALLMALFNLSPFLNFIEDAANSKAFNDPIFVGLHSLAQAFHKHGEHQEADEKDQKEKVWSLVETLWEYITAEGASQVGPWKAESLHPAELLYHILSRLELAQLQQGQVGDGNDVNLSTRFKQLFKYFTVRLAPMRCGCSQPVLQRQATGHGEQRGYFTPAYVRESMKLEQAISEIMWENDKYSGTKTCPACHTEMNVGVFNTFAYLPEVLFISPVFISASGGDGDRYTTEEKFIYPEWLDMSAFRDDPERPGDQTDRIYKLQSIITCTNQDSHNPGAKTRYKPSLRLSMDEWVQYGYEAGSGWDYITFEDINDPGRRETSEEAPCLLMYVRDRLVKDSGILPDVITPQPPLPRTNAELVEEYGQESSNLERFVKALNQPGKDGSATAFESAKSELGKGRKDSHWMWFMFPQVLQERRSKLGEFYAIKSLGEAIAYWKHTALKGRYIELLQVVLKSPQTSLEKLFGGKIDADKFQASLTLFALTCNDKERGLFEQVFRKFHKKLHEQTMWTLIEWVKNEREAIAWIKVYAQLPADHEKQETKAPDRGGLATLVTSPGALAYDEDGSLWQFQNTFDELWGEITPDDAAMNLFAEVLRLARTDVDDGDEDKEVVALWNQRGELIGRLILGFTLPGNPPPDGPLFRERARRLGRNLMLLSKPAEEPAAAAGAEEDFGSEAGVIDDLADPEDKLAMDEDYEPDNDYLFDDVQETESVGEFGLDGSYDEPSEGADLDEEDPHTAVAIPSDPNDPRIDACQNWTVEELKSEFQKEQLDWRGLRNDAKKHRMKFLKHFELERDYSIYHESRLRQAVRERGIVLSEAEGKVDKAVLVDALTEYDTQVLGEREYVEEGSEETSSADFESEGDQSSEMTTETDASSGNGATPRPKKRLRFEYEEEEEEDEIVDDEEDGDYIEGDYDDEDGEATPRGSPKGTTRMRTRY